MATIIAIALCLQDSIYETKYKHQKDLLAIPGVKSVSVGGVDGKMAIVVTVENEASKDAIVAKYGETLDGHLLHVIVSGGSKKTETKPATTESKPTVTTTASVPGTLRDYSIPYFPTGKKPAATTTTPELTPEEQALLDGLMPKPKKKEESTTTTTPQTETGPGRNRTTTTTSGPTRDTTTGGTGGPTRTTTTTTQDGPRWTRPTGTTTTGVPTRHWTPSGGNTITRNTGGAPT